MRYLLIISFLVLSLTLFIQAQDPPKAVLFDEFSSVNECQIGANLDSFFVTLQNHPQANGTIIVYRSKDILPADYDSTVHIRYYISYPRFRGFDEKRITVIDGGFREKLSTELWIVPERSTPPGPTKTVSKPKVPKTKTFLYDRKSNLYFEEFELQPRILISDDGVEIGTYQPEIDEGLNEEERQEIQFEWLNNKFGEFLKKNKNSIGVLIYYADKDQFDVGKITLHIERARKKLVKNSNLSPNQIQIFYGGYRSMIEVEYWVMTKNSGFPEVRPETKKDEHSTNKHE